MRRRWLLILLALAGCERQLSLGTLERSRSGDAGTRAPTATPFACAERGPLFDVGDGTRGACGGDSAGFHHALCSCGAITTEATLQVDGFDSTREAYAPGAASGALGMNGALFAHDLTLGGSLTVAGETGAPLQGDLSVGASLAVRGPLQGAHTVLVAGDARIASDVRLTRIEVGGRFTLAQGAAFAAGVDSSVPARGDVDVIPPCRCDDGLDVASLIAAARDDNDDARAGLDPAEGLKALAPRTVSLPCGRYYVEDVYAARGLTLRIAGRVALYVAQRIVTDAPAMLEILLDEDAELDLIVGGGVAVNGPARIGSPLHPDRVRIYVGGGVPSGRGDNVYFGRESVIAASIHAPHSELVASRPFTLYGAALLASVVFSDASSLHFDRALVRDTCEASACARDEDCSAPLRCDGTRCLP